MNSPEHRANILDHDFTQVGVGVSVDKNGIIWVTEDFRQPMGSSTTATHSTTSHSRAGSASTASSSSGYTAPSSFTPRPAPSPRAVLLQRLHELRHRHAAAHTAGDPVAQAFDYLHALSALTR